MRLGKLGIGGLLRLDPARIQVDLWQFDAALARGDEVAAISVYRGPFLDGFYLSGLDEFERWMESQRERAGRRYGTALRILAERAEASDDRVAAVAWFGMGHDTLGEWRLATFLTMFFTNAAIA